MYKPRKYQRLDTIRHFPKLEDLRRLSADAFKARGCIIELPWHSCRTTNIYTLTVIVELAENEILWTLFVGEGEEARVLWSTPASDLEMLMDVMTLSLPEEVDKAQIPTELTHGAKTPAATPGFMQALPPGYAYPPGYAGPQANYPYPPGYYPPPVPGYAPAAYPPGYQIPPGYPAPPGYFYPSGTYPAVGYRGQPDGRSTGPVAVPYPMPAPQGVPTSPATPFAGVEIASTLPMQLGPPAASEPANAAAVAAVAARSDGAPKKRANIMLGQFLVMADLVPQKTLDCALILQDLFKNGGLSLDQASEALVKAHNRGGDIEASAFTARETSVEKNLQAPPLGQLLLKAGLIDGGALTSALKFQQAARTGELQKDSALAAFVQETFGKSKSHNNDGPQLDKALSLLVRVGLLPEQDLQMARNLKAKHGGALMNILTTAGKIDAKTLESSLIVQALLDEKRLKDEQAAVALHYCHRSRVTFDEAIEELGWTKP